MGWVTLSLRKMALKQRVSNLEYRLVQISQQQQTLDNTSSYSQRQMGMLQNQQMMLLNSDRLNYLKDVRGSFSSEGSTYEDQLELQQRLDEINFSYQFNQMNMESVFQAEEDALLKQVNIQQQQLELEQQQIQTQLAAAQAELESLDSAITNDIKNGAIKLTS